MFSTLTAYTPWSDRLPPVSGFVASSLGVAFAVGVAVADEVGEADGAAGVAGGAWLTGASERLAASETTSDTAPINAHPATASARLRPHLGSVTRESVSSDRGGRDTS